MSEKYMCGGKAVIAISFPPFALPEVRDTDFLQKPSCQVTKSEAVCSYLGNKEINRNGSVCFYQTIGTRAL